jgi:hypothetical protein
MKPGDAWRRVPEPYTTTRHTLHGFQIAPPGFITHRPWKIMFKLNPIGRISNVKWILLESTLIDIADINLRNVSPAETEDHDIIRRYSRLVKEQSHVFNLLMRHFDVRREQVFLAYCETLYAENLSVRAAGITLFFAITSIWQSLLQNPRMQRGDAFRFATILCAEVSSLLFLDCNDTDSILKLPESLSLPQ